MRIVLVRKVMLMYRKCISLFYNEFVGALNLAAT